MSLTQHNFQLESELLHPEIPPAPSLSAILKLDPTAALRENFNIREFTLRTLAKETKVTEPPAATVDSGSSRKLQVCKPPESAAGHTEDQVDETLQVVRASEHAYVKDGQAEEGKASGGALELLLLASAGHPREANDEHNTACPFCNAFSTDSAIVLSSHIVDCIKEQRKGETKTVADDSPPVRNNPAEQVLVASGGHGARPLSQRPPEQTMKRASRKRTARECTDFIMEPMKKRRRGRGIYKGVKKRSSGRWAAQISNVKKKIHLWLGTFDTAREAAMAYDRAAIKILGAAAETNILSAEDVASGVVHVPVVSGEDGTRLEVSPVEGITIVRRAKGRPRKQRQDEFFVVPVTYGGCEADERPKGRTSMPEARESVEVPVTVKAIEQNTVVVASGRLERGRPCKVKSEGGLLSVGAEGGVGGREMVPYREDSPRPLAKKEPHGKAVIGRTVVEVLD